MDLPFHVDLSKEGLYTFFIDNHRTSNHHSVIFGLRELNSSEKSQFCSNLSPMSKDPPLPNEQFNFTFDYELRLFTSACFYLDDNQQWKSDRLTVGPLTNHYETQCFSTHLTRFASAFQLLPEPLGWHPSFPQVEPSTPSLHRCNDSFNRRDSSVLICDESGHDRLFLDK